MAPRRGNRVDRSERVAVFGNTKLCKFHILGVCQKGASCNFAHDAGQLNSLPDLAKTRICKTLISTGRCDDPNCSYAHSKEELREMPPAPEKTQPHAAQPHAVPVPPPPVPPPVMPTFALPLGQTHQAPVQDPAVQVLMLQQMAAMLSMQAAMLRAQPPPVQPPPSVQALQAAMQQDHSPVQPPPSVQSLQCPTLQKEMYQSSKVCEEKISVDFSNTFEVYPVSKFADDEPAKLPTDFIVDPLPVYSKNFQDTPMPQGVVKNTFLDFQPERRPDGMRAVQTCLGGFSFMTGADDDDDDEA